MTSQTTRDTERRTRWLAGFAIAVLLVALYYAIQFPSVWLGGKNFLGGPELWLRNGAWLYMVQHHLAQMALALVVIGVAGRMRFGEWGLNLGNWKRSLRMTRSFTVIFAVVIAVGIGLQVAGGIEPREAPRTGPEIAGWLFFMIVVSGLSEEILFRGMMQTWLSRWFPAQLSLPGLKVPAAGLLTAVIFAAVHINFTLVPLQVTHFYAPQVFIAFVLGVVYSVAYHRTGSLLAPILMHNIANGLMALSPLIVGAIGTIWVQ